MNYNGADSTESLRTRAMHRAGFSGVAFRLLNMAVLVVTTPILVRSLGDASFGIFVTITSFSAYLALSDLGVGAGLLTVLGGDAGIGDKRVMARHVVAAGWILLAASVIVALAGLGTSVLLDIPSLLGAPPEDAAAAQLAFQVFVVGFAIGIPLTLGARVQQSLQQGAEAAGWNTLTTSLSAVAAAATAVATGSIVPTILASTVVSGLVGAMQMVRVHKQHPWITKFGLRFNASEARVLMVSSGWLLALQITAVVAFQTDLLVVSALLGADQAAVYNGTLRLFAIVSLVTTALAAQFWPASAEALSGNDRAWVAQTHKRLSWQLPALAGAASLVVVGIGQTLIRLWLGADLVPPMALLIAFAIWTTYTAFLTPFSQVLNGAGVLKPQVFLSGIMAAANIGLSIYFTRLVGLAGPLLGSLAASSLILFVPYIVLVRRLLRGGPVDQRHAASSGVKPESVDG